jgi:hypothetical protein
LLTLLNILFTSGATIVGGVLVFVVGQITVKFIIEPIQRFRKTLGDIQYAIIFHQASYSTPGGKEELEKEASETFKRLAGELCSKAKVIPFYDRLSSIAKTFLPPMDKVLSATTSLRSLSNSVQAQDRFHNLDKANQISDLLNLQKVI